MELRLLVLRSNIPEKTASFYSLLGFSFEYHQHGNGPFHYSAKMEKAILEIYPLTKSQTEADKNIRLGFAIEHFESTIDTLKKHNVTFTLEPTDTEFGFMAIIIDPDQRKVELYKK